MWVRRRGVLIVSTGLAVLISPQIVWDALRHDMDWNDNYLCVDLGVCFHRWMKLAASNSECISDVCHTNYNPKVQALCHTNSFVTGMKSRGILVHKYMKIYVWHELWMSWRHNTQHDVFLKVTQPCFRAARFRTYCPHSLPLGHSVPICTCSNIFPPSYYCLLGRACLSVCVFRAEWGHIVFPVFPSLLNCSSSDTQPTPLQDQRLDHLSAPSVYYTASATLFGNISPCFCSVWIQIPISDDQSSIQFLQFSLPDSNL